MISIKKKARAVRIKKAPPRSEARGVIKENLVDLAFEVGRASGFIQFVVFFTVRAFYPAENDTGSGTSKGDVRLRRGSIARESMSADMVKAPSRLLIGGTIVSETALLLTVTGLILSELLVFGIGGLIIYSLGAVVTLILGIPVFKKTGQSIFKDRQWNLNQLIAVSVILALFAGEVIFALFLTWAIRLSIAMQERNKIGMRKALAELMDSRDRNVWLVNEEGLETKADISEVEKGDTLIFHAGENIWVDGKIVSGEAAINQAAFSGESVPEYKKQGDNVYNGTLVAEGEIRVMVTGVGNDTEFGNIIRSVEGAREMRAPLTNISDNFARVFVPLAFGVSLATFFATGSLVTAATVLIMSAPCAVLLAAPSAVFAGVRNGARRSIIIKGGVYLEGMGLTETIFFDKTGTLTEGKPKIVKIIPLTGQYSEEALLSYAGSGEYYSMHPFARAIVERAACSHIKIKRLDSYKVLPGKGVTTVFKDGSSGAVGGRSLLRELNVKSFPRLNAISNTMKENGQSVVYVIKDGSTIGIIGLIDQPRDEARAAITKLRKDGIKKIVMLTGDHLRVAEAVAGALGVDEVRSDLSPQEKLEYIKQYKLAHPGQVLAMVGEGLNDVPAMAFSDIGIAFGEHTNDPVLNEAGIVIVDNDIQKVADLVSLGKRTRRIIKQNYVVGVGVNIIGMFLGAAGMISPLIGLLFHEAATATVLLNSSRLLAQRKNHHPSTKA